MSSMFSQTQGAIRRKYGVSGPEVVGFGAMNVDRLYRVPQTVADGETMAQGPAVEPGGSAANTIYGLAKLGLQVGFVGAVGDDAEGRMLLRDLHEVGAETQHVVAKPGQRTGETLGFTDGRGHRALYVSSGANRALEWGDLPLDYLRQVRLLHLSSFADADQFRLQNRLVLELSPLPLLTLAPGARYAEKRMKGLELLLRHVQLLFLNRAELEQLTGRDVPTGIKRCLTAGCQAVVVTLGRGFPSPVGKEGEMVALVADREGSAMVEAPPMPGLRVEDITGAGDAFAAGFLYGFLQERPLSTCGALGHVMATFAVSQVGARAGLPSREELAQRYQQLYGEPL